MKTLLALGMVLVCAGGISAQTPAPGPNAGRGGPPGPPPKLTDQGFSEAEAKAVEADLKAWDSARKEQAADLDVLEAQIRRLMIRDTIDKAEVEKLLRSQYEAFLKRDLARIDLLIQWRKTYGTEKSRVLEGRLQGPQNQGGPGGPGMKPEEGADGPKAKTN